VTLRAPHLHSALRSFCLGSFAFFGREIEGGADIQFVFEEHGSRDRPTFYVYRPLVRAFVEARGGRILGLDDTTIALEALGREPAAAIYARAHAGARAEHALFRTVLLPLVGDVAQSCGGFDWDDDSFDRAYGALEQSMFGEKRAYAAVAPLVGLEAGGIVELGEGLRVRHAADGELGAHWPDAARLVPDDFGRETDRMCVLELERSLPSAEAEPPDAPGEIADAVTALRLATAGPIAVGPVLFERLDWRPFGVRPMLPIAAAPPPGESIRLDVFRGGVAQLLRERLALAEDDRELGEALDRWELSLFQDAPFRAEQLRSALDALLGAGDGSWAAALRAAVLLGENGRERAKCLAVLCRLGDGVADDAAVDLVRRALVEMLSRGDRARLVAELDESLLGVRARPAGRVAHAVAS
jgi:hypothetical protein